MTVNTGQLLAGEIGKPHGTRGEVYVNAVSDDPVRFRRGAVLMHEDGREMRIEAARTHGNRLLIKFAGFDSREEAERLRGALFVPAQDARALKPGEFWPHELVGCQVDLRDLSPVGTVLGVIPGAAQDLLSVATPRGDRLIPMVGAIVVEVDLGQRRIVVDPPEGLLD